MKILLVEDEQKLADALKMGLENRGFEVDVSYIGTQGKEMALTGSYDLMIIDRMLPYINDGLEIVQACSKKGIKTPIIILTARSTVKDKVDGLNVGADDYITKPFAFAELLARINALLRRPQDTKKTALLEFGPLKAYLDEKKVYKNDKPLDLSKKEFELLTFLMKNPNRVVSKEAIIDNVWHTADEVSANSVEVYIRYIRTKIDGTKKPKNSIIKTVRGFGYKLSED